MTIALPELEKAALDLEPKIRAKLAAVLIQSLEAAPNVDEREMEELGLAEAQERCRQIDAGEADLLPADEVLKELRERR